MAKKLDPQTVFDKACQDRQAYPLQLPGNPYKLAEARHKLARSLDTARAALAHERNPRKGDGQVWLGGCLAYERRRWTRKQLGEWTPYVLGYDAVPGLEVMARANLLTRFSHAVHHHILPAAAAGLALPKGEAMMLHLVELLERTLGLIDEALAACEVAHV